MPRLVAYYFNYSYDDTISFITKRESVIRLFKKHTIYKHDKYNMLTVEEQGKTLVVRKISDQWGEEGFQFVSRAELMDWAGKHFRPGDFIGKEDELEQIMQNLRSI
ncbi:hypothetical protein J40TS1_10460 [Paenibacillus montaniterrae]|uniref:Uncharacterized protein n=1 Tax=Paenibacillus montaniterrae TaxID=429341 RepID=A0A919YNL5_9BACL|nr:hypothetical protein J40TS1_10460 [Paenibacillus montaniterrae]